MPTLQLNRPQSSSLHALRPKLTQCFPWSRGVGKSFWERQLAQIQVRSHDGRDRPGALKPLRGIRIIWLMPSLKQFKKVHGGAFEEEINGDWAGLRGKLNHTDFRVEYPGGSWIQPFPAELYRSRFALGLRADAVVFDEMDDIDLSVYRTVVRPWFSEPWSLKMVFGGGTPRKGRHGLLWHLHSLGLDPDEPRYWTKHATYRDAPETVDREEVEEARKHDPPAIFRREWECDFDAAEGLVYGDVWDERFHVIGAPDCPHERPPDHFTEWAVCGDAGFATPGCLYLIGITGKGADAICWVLEEVYRAGETEDFWLGIAKKWADYDGLRGAPLYMDPQGASLAARIDASTRLHKADVNKSVEEGIRTVATLLKKHGTEEPTARLFVSPDCKNLIYEFGAYRRKSDPREQDRYLEQVVKKNDHGLDALRYFAHSHFPPEAIGGREFRSLDNRP